MSFFDSLLLNSIFIVLPICFYLLVMLKKRNNNSFNLLIPLACFTAMYLVFRYSIVIEGLKSMFFINVPLIILIVYRKKYSTLLASLFIIFFYYYLFSFSLYFLVIEYMIYFIIFHILKIKNKSFEFKLNVFIFIKGIILTIIFVKNGNTTSYLFFYQFCNLIIFYLVTTVIVYAIERGEDIVKYNNVLQELEKEKILKSSLFKITHEVKNPLAVCKGYLSMINLDDYNKSKRYIDIISSEINRTLDIMDNFSMYTKIKINKDIMDMSYLIEDVISSVKLILDDNNIEVLYNGPDEVLMNGDYNRLKQVLINVIKNSNEAMNGKGKINILLKPRKKYVNLFISDNGKGIEPSDLKKLGELFYSSKDKGCGIGVALSMEIVKLHDGQMKYSSVLGEGTTVMIKLPK